MSRPYKCLAPFSSIYRITHVLSRSLAWFFYGTNLAGLSPRIAPKCHGHKNVSFCCLPFIVQFLSLLSGWLWSRSVSLINGILYGLNLARVSLRIFVRENVAIHQKSLRALFQEPLQILVTCHLHGETSWSMVCANGKQKLQSGKFCQDCHVPFAQFTLINRPSPWWRPPVYKMDTVLGESKLA